MSWSFRRESAPLSSASKGSRSMSQRRPTRIAGSSPVIAARRVAFTLKPSRAAASATLSVARADPRGALEGIGIGFWRARVVWVLHRPVAHHTRRSARPPNKDGSDYPTWGIVRRKCPTPALEQSVGCVALLSGVLRLRTEPASVVGREAQRTRAGGDAGPGRAGCGRGAGPEPRWSPKHTGTAHSVRGLPDSPG
jgi:hypothetical protein